MGTVQTTRRVTRDEPIHKTPHIVTTTIDEKRRKRDLTADRLGTKKRTRTARKHNDLEQHDFDSKTNE